MVGVVRICGSPTFFDHDVIIINFCRTIAMMGPDDSWVAKWQRISKLPICACVHDSVAHPGSGGETLPFETNPC